MKKAQAGHLGPLVIVQWIKVEWGKDARGAEQATRRNALPTAYALPERELKPGTRIVVQRFSFNGASAFERTSERVNQYPDLTSGNLPGVDLERDGTRLLLNPRMLFLDIHRPQIALTLGQWSRLIWNERLVSNHTTRYVQTTLNIAYLPQFDPTIFLNQSPLAERSDLQTLY